MTDMNIEAAKNIVWEYMQIGGPTPKWADAVIVLGSRDDRVAQHAARVLESVGHGSVYITGGSAHHADLLATPSWDEPSEAAHFATVMRRAGYGGDIILEESATNTGQNAQLVQRLMEAEGKKPGSLLVVTKPYMERRALKTFEKQWTYGQPRIYVSSVGGSLDEYVNHEQPEDLVCNVMVGDLERIIAYPAMGFMAPSNVPGDVRDALNVLQKAGYTKHSLT